MPRAKTPTVEPETVADEKIMEVSTENPEITPVVEKVKKEEEGLSKTEMMKRALAKQPKRTIIIPLEGKEKRGTTETVIVNGYRFEIMKGEYVEVPEQIAQIIMDAKQQTTEAYRRAQEQAPEKMLFNN